MGKRAMPVTTVATEKQRQSKVARTVEAPADPFLEECTPLLRFLGATDAGGGLSSVSREMLQSMAPHALRSYKADRHQFQDRMVDSIASLMDEDEKKHCALVKKAEDAIAEHASEETKVSAELEEAVTAVAASNGAKDERQCELKALSVTLQASKEAEAAVRERQNQLRARQTAQADEKSECERLLSEVYEPLKNNTYMAQGKDWRERNKGVDKIVNILGAADAGETLCATIAVVLKQKAADREKFGEQALECAEAALKERAQSVGEAIANFEAETAEMDKEVADAEQVTASAQAKHDTAANDWIAAENSWGDCKQKEFDIKNVLADLKSKSEPLTKAVGKTIKDRDTFLELAALFQKLSDRNAEEPALDIAIDSTPQAASIAPDVVVDAEMPQAAAVA